jgi:6-phosphogluconolactonase (cycloisomerase 2 family)
MTGAASATVSPRPATACALDVLEPRRLLAGASLPDVVYVQTNDPGANAILAYHRDPQSGVLTEFGRFPTGGKGFLNASDALGPDDSDQEIVTIPSRRLLYTINQGSNDISAFRYADSGALTLIGRFGSEGVQPVSIGLVSDDQVVVVNRGNTRQPSPGNTPGNYVSFRVKHDGALKRVPNSAVTLDPRISPAQALVAPDGSFVFGNNFVPPPDFSITEQVESFTLRPNNRLERVAGSPFGADVTPPTILGLQNHPSQRIVYAGLVAANQLGVFTYDDAGALDFVTAVPAGGMAICWISIDRGGRFAYGIETGTNTVSVVSRANPLQPVLIQTIQLAGLQRPVGDPVGPPLTNPFQSSLDADGRHLYVVNHQTAPGNVFPQGNALHTLNVGADGRLSEPTPPIVFDPADVPPAANPRGVLVLSATGVGEEADAPPDGFEVSAATRIAFGSFSNTVIGQADDEQDNAVSALVAMLA